MYKLLFLVVFFVGSLAVSTSVHTRADEPVPMLVLTLNYFGEILTSIPTIPLMPF